MWPDFGTEVNTAIPTYVSALACSCCFIFCFPISIKAYVTQFISTTLISPVAFSVLHLLWMAHQKFPHQRDGSEQRSLGKTSISMNTSLPRMHRRRGGHLAGTLQADVSEKCVTSALVVHRTKKNPWVKFQSVRSDIIKANKQALINTNVRQSQRRSPGLCRQATLNA